LTGNGDLLFRGDKIPANSEKFAEIKYVPVSPLSHPVTARFEIETE